MMTADDKILTLFAAKTRQLLLKYEQLKAENERRRQELEARQESISSLDSQLKTAQEHYNSLMTARMLEVSEGDMEAAKARLAKLIRSVDKCITLLSEK